MMQRSRIEWTDATWNPVRGCSRISQGCQNCYAERIAKRFRGTAAFRGFARQSGWTGRVRLLESKLEEPLSWRKPRMVFVNSMSDLFHEKLNTGSIARIFNVMASGTLSCSERIPLDDHDPECWSGQPHTFQVLTKRSERMREIIALLPEYVGETFPGDAPLAVAMELGHWPLPNVWLGVSVENQACANWRIPDLLATPAAMRFISYEPALGPVDLLRVERLGRGRSALHVDCEEERHLDWVIAGGESGPGARAPDLRWFRSVRDQCVEAKVPFFFKQWGGPHKKKSGRLLDGREWNEFPEGGS